MIQAIKKEVTVLPGGRIELQSSELKAGMQAEVIVFLPATPPGRYPLSSLIGKGKGAYDSPEQADEYIRKERDEWE